MMIPERLGTATMTIGAARPALEIATNYTARRKAFRQVIAQFEGVSFQIAEAAMLLDAARAMSYVTARAVDAGADMNRIRRMVSQSKKFITESCQKVVHNSMQVMGGIAYTNVFPIERIYRDVRLASIWTGTSEVMSMIPLMNGTVNISLKRRNRRHAILNSTRRKPPMKRRSTTTMICGKKGGKV